MRRPSSCDPPVTDAICQRRANSLKAEQPVPVRLRGEQCALKILVFGVGMMIAIAAFQIPADYAFAAGPDFPIAASAATPAPTANPAKPLQGEAAYKQASEKLNRVYAGLDVINGKIDRSLFEIDALADRLGSDPTTIFKFVRDEIRYEPYTGVLRGALGTLLCRAGNSLDRSLLLAALLQKAGLRTQIASGKLSPQQAQTLVNRLFEPVKPVPSALPSLAELAPDLGQAMGVDMATLLRKDGEIQKYGEQQYKAFENYVNGETSVLAGLLGKAGVDLGVVASNGQLLAEAREHYWIQYLDANERWVDLDPAFADAQPGKAFVSAAGVFATDSIPEELYHHLRASITLRVAEIGDGHDGPTNDILLLDQELRVAEQQGQDIGLANSPVPMPNYVTPSVVISEALAPTKGFQTLLQIGDRVLAGKYFDLDGKVSDDVGGPVGDVVTNAGGIGKSVGGLSGGINGIFGGKPAAQVPTRIVGEWADYTLTSPRPNGEAPEIRSYHRNIIAPSQVTSWSAISPGSPQQIPTNLDKAHLRQRLFWFAELLPVIGATPLDYPGYLAMKSILENRASIDSLAQVKFGLSPAADFGSPPIRLPIANLSLAAGVTQLIDNLRETQFPKLKSYFGRPGLIAYETATGDTTNRFRRGYDIVAFSPRIVGNAMSASAEIRRDASSLHLMGGVLATRLEWALTTNAPDGSASGFPSSNATLVFGAAKERSIPVVVLQPGSDGLKKLSDASVPASVKAELSATLATGDFVVVPVSPVLLDGRQQVAWWRFEPASGEVIGVMPGGRGQESTEYAKLIWQVFSGLYCFADFALSEKNGKEVLDLMKCGAASGVMGVGGSFIPKGHAVFSVMVMALDIASVVEFHLRSISD